MRCASTGAPVHWLLIGYQTCKVPTNVWPANIKPAVAIMGWPHFLQQGSLPPSHALLQCPEFPNVWSTETSFSPPYNLAKCNAAAANMAAPMHLTSLGKYQMLSSFAHESSDIHKSQSTESQPNLSPEDAVFKTVSHLRRLSAWTVAHFWVCMSSRPSEKTLHTPKKASRARSRSLWLLYIKPLQFCAAHLSLKIESKNSLSLLNAPRGRKNAEQKDTTLNGAMRCKQLSQNLVSFFFCLFFFLFFFSFLIPWKRLARRVCSELMLSEEPSCLWRSAERSPEETCTFPRNLLLHSKNSESVSIWRTPQALRLDSIL